MNVINFKKVVVILVLIHTQLKLAVEPINAGVWFQFLTKIQSLTIFYLDYTLTEVDHIWNSIESKVSIL